MSWMIRSLTLVIAVCAVLSVAVRDTRSIRQPNALPRITSDRLRQQITTTYARLPLSFEANQGQTDGSVKFLSRTNGAPRFLTPTESVLSLSWKEKAAV